MPRLSAIDRAFFLLETEQRPMNVGLLFVVAPRRVARGRPSDEIVRRMLRCPVGPPFDYALAPGGWPQLVEAGRVDAAKQVFRHELPSGSDHRALYEGVCSIHSRRLDRARPLWEMHVFDGLAQGRVALYFKTHHGLVDGLGLLEVIQGAVTSKPGGSAPQAIWRGLPDTSSGRPAAPAAPRPRPGIDPFALLRDGLATARSASELGRIVLHLGRRNLGLGYGLPTPFVSTPNVLKAPPSPNRVLGHCRLPLARVRAVAKAGDAKVNDVLLATLDLALSRYLAGHRVHVDRPLVADVPVALQDDRGAGNRITILQVPLGRPGGSPADRLADVVRETRVLKDEVRALSSQALYLYSIATHAMASTIETLNLGDLPMLANTVISNPAGLPGKVWFNGVPVESALPLSVVAHHQALNVTVSDYAHGIDVTFMALREALPDVQRLADATARAFADLARAVGPPAPRRRRRPTAAPPRPARRGTRG